jgi:hypothetical protein
MNQTVRTGFATALIVAYSHQSVGQAASNAAQAAGVRAVLQCRQVADEHQRLACFEKAAAELERSAVAQAAPRAQAAPADAAVASGRFGLPAVRSDEPEEALRGVVRSVRSTREGWLVTLDDDSVWQQADARTSAIDPEVGKAVTIRRAALGSYRLMLNGKIGFKVQRIR